MGFFAEFDAWLTSILATYVSGTVVRVASAIEPAAVALAVIYVMGWGYLHLTGRVEEPVQVGLKRIAMLVLVFGVGLRLWLYFPVVVDTFTQGPAQLAARVLGAASPVTIIDEILWRGGDAASALLEKGSLLDGSIAYILAGFIVYAVVGVTALYTAFLLALARVATAVLLALGPLFIVLALFESSRRFFERWVVHLVNFALVTVLTVMVVSLLMQVLTIAATQAATVGAGIEVAHAVRLCLAAGIVLLVLRQVLGMAAGLAHGFALSSAGVVSRLASGVLRGVPAASLASLRLARASAARVSATRAPAAHAPASR